MLSFVHYLITGSRATEGNFPKHTLKHLFQNPLRANVRNLDAETGWVLQWGEWGGRQRMYEHIQILKLNLIIKN